MSRARVIQKIKGQLRGHASIRKLSTAKRGAELKARLKRAQTPTVKPKGRLPNAARVVSGLIVRLKDVRADAYGLPRGEIYTIVSIRPDKKYKSKVWVRVAEASGDFLASDFRVEKRAVNPKPNGFFDSDAVASAKKVKRIHKVQERNTKEGGEIIGVQPGGFIKVKWDNRERPTLIKRSEIKRYPYLRNPGNTWIVRLWDGYTGKALADIEVIARTAKEARDEAKKEWGRESDLVYKKGQLRAEADRVANPGIMELAGGLQALDYLGEKVGVGKAKRTRRNGDAETRRNPKRYSRAKEHRDFRRKEYNQLKSLPFLSSEQKKHFDWLREQVVKDNQFAFKEDREKRNPSVNEMSERFQGRATGKIEDYYFSDSAPRLDMSRGGKLVFLKLKGTTIRVPSSVVAIDPKTEKLWLGCKSQNGMFKRKAKSGEQLDYGDVDAVCYLTAKKHIGNSKPYEYVHNFGENGGRKPRLLIDHEGMPILKGGDYKIEDRGIVN